MRKLIILALLSPLSAFAQGTLGGTNDTFDGPSSYSDFGPNYSMFGQMNINMGGFLYQDHMNYSWQGTNDDGEIEEVTVIAKRLVNHGWQLYSFINLNLTGEEICTNYTDGGHCNATDTFYDPNKTPIDEGCQTVTGHRGPLTGQEANDLNVEYLNGQAVGAAVLTAFSTGGGLAIGGAPGGLIAALGAAVATYSSFVGELPFKYGDNVDWTLEVCNDGEGGVNSTLHTDIT
ncbi:MAG TPA: hypothetical protein PKK10_14260 [Woeseiaceae bacterium]|nr:hypothetical protein [Woeseiaceae bacterium]